MGCATHDAILIIVGIQQWLAKTLFLIFVEEVDYSRSMGPAIKNKLSLAEYNRLEQENNMRYEYHNGEVFAMAGGEPKHSLIANNIGALLRNALLSKDCMVFNSDAKYHIATSYVSCYPDVSVICGSAERSDKDVRALTNPLLLVEVLSETTAAYDQGAKFHTYSQLSSLREYVLVEQDEQRVQVFYRPAPQELWQMQWFSQEDNEIILRSIDTKILLADVYHRTEGL